MTMYEINGTKLVVAEKEDFYASIAAEFGIYSWQIKSYNNLSKKIKIQIGYRKLTFIYENM
jgi:LysM repeat protein